MLSSVITSSRAVRFLRKNVHVTKRFSHDAKTGRIMSQGLGVFGALGQGPDIRDSNKFQSISSFQFTDGDSLPVRLASAGWGHSAAVSDSGKLYIFGRPFDFQNLLRIDRINKLSSWLARAMSGTTALFGSDTKGGFFSTPFPIEAEAPIKDIRCTAGLTVFLTETGNVYTFGLNRWGQCGVLMSAPMALQSKDVTTHVTEPMQVPIPPCQAVDAGLQHCLALTETGEIYSWGKASKGQLGNINGEADKIPPYALPTLVPLEPFKEYKGKAFANGAEVDPVKTTQISAGFSHSAALTSEGRVYLWGKGMSLQIRDKSKDYVKVCENQLLPRKVDLPGGRKAVRICSSNFQLIILAEDGSLWAVGMGEHDRNANPLPLRVQTDFHLPRVDGDTTGATATAERDPEDGRNYLVVPVNAHTLLCKGNHRVTLVMQETSLDAALAEAALLPPTTSSSSSDVIISPSEKNRANFPEQGIFDVIVHEGEAYLLEVEVAVEKESEDAEEPQLRLLNYSAGWKHKLLVVEDL